jgi:electron transport complex protein RnfC
MKKLSFKKGWLPMDGLAFAGEKDFPREPVLEIFTPRDIVLPMLQHIGTPAEPIVVVGDKVTIGQLIGKPTSPLCAPVHSGISGTVTDISEIALPNGARCQAVTIHNDLKRTLHSSVKPRKMPENLTPNDLMRLLEYSGVVGLGGNGYPTSAKCRRAEITGVETVLINACQSEPYLSCDIHLLREQTERVLGGASALAGLCRAKRIVFCLQDKWSIELKALQQSFDKYRTQFPDREFSIRVFRSRFPQGYQKLLIKALYNVELASGQLPEEASGVLVLNASTCAAFWDMVEKNMPLTSRVISIFGDTTHGHNILVPIGTKVKELLERVPGAASAQRIIWGGALTGVAIEDLNVPIIKTTAGISIINKTNPPQTSCIQCGNCVDACPVGLAPYLCSRLAEMKEIDALKAEGIENCIACGACSYVCPAGIDLSVNIARAAHKARKGVPI